MTTSKIIDVNRQKIVSTSRARKVSRPSRQSCKRLNIFHISYEQKGLLKMHVSKIEKIKQRKTILKFGGVDDQQSRSSQCEFDPL